MLIILLNLLFGYNPSFILNGPQFNLTNKQTYTISWSVSLLFEEKIYVQFKNRFKESLRAGGISSQFSPSQFPSHRQV